MAGVIRQEGNIFWKLLLFQRTSVNIAVKEEMNQFDGGQLFRKFRDNYSKNNPLEMKYGIRILDIYYRLILPDTYKKIEGLTTYQQLERYYSDLKADSTV